MRPALIVAMAANRVIGRDGGMPWHLPADLARFKRLTMGHHIVMGRKTHESLGRLLPGRTTVIVSRRPDYRVDGAMSAHSLDEALSACAGDEEPFVIGGGELYRAALPRVQRLYLTLVHTWVEGDTTMPEIDPRDWRELDREDHAADEKNPHAYSFVTLERR